MNDQKCASYNVVSATQSKSVSFVRNLLQLNCRYHKSLKSYLSYVKTLYYLLETDSNYNHLYLVHCLHGRFSLDMYRQHPPDHEGANLCTDSIRGCFSSGQTQLLCTDAFPVISRLHAASFHQQSPAFSGDSHVPSLESICLTIPTLLSIRSPGGYDQTLRFSIQPLAVICSNYPRKLSSFASSHGCMHRKDQYLHMCR